MLLCVRSQETKSVGNYVINKMYLKDAFNKKNPFKGTLCLSVCTPDPQKVIGIIENVRGSVKKKP